MNNFPYSNAHPAEQTWFRAATPEPSNASSEPIAEPTLVPEPAEDTAPIQRQSSTTEQQALAQVPPADIGYMQAYARALNLDGK